MNTDRWTVAKANAWWSARQWVCGFNFLPSTAVNFLEMWHRDTFDRNTIERELRWASEIGFNALRTNLHFLVWKHDREGLLERLDWTMAVSDRLGIAMVPCLFDDCGFGGFEPKYGPQPKPVPGVHNGRAVASPGRSAIMDRNLWPEFEAYVRDIARSFRGDTRILFWDLYNEPGNRMIFEPAGFRVHEPDTADTSRKLMIDSFSWFRSELPDQPLTVGAWTTPPVGSGDAPYQTEIDDTALALSDIVTFHAYRDAANVRQFIQYLAPLGRPIICTEWMARAVGSCIEDQLELFKQCDVGCFQWGLVSGRTQTNLPWPAELVESHGGNVDGSVWFQDLLQPSGLAYDPEETEKIKILAGPS